MSKELLNFLIYLLLIDKIVYAISNQITELTIGELTEIEQSSHSLNFFSFNDTNIDNVQIFLRKENGSPILYGYSSNSETEFPKTENDIYELDFIGELKKAQNIYHTLYLDMNIENNEKNILIVLCPDNINCSYSINIIHSGVSFRIKSNKSYYTYFSLELPLTLYLNESTITNNSHLNLYITPVNGIIQSINCLKDNLPITPIEKVLSINDFYSFSLSEKDKDSIIQITMNPKFSIYTMGIYTMALIRYTIEENQNEIIYVEKGVSQLHDISFGDKRTFIFQSLSHNLIFFIKSQSCSLHIQEIESNQVINSYFTSFYQVIYKPTDSYQIQISLDNSNTNNCKFLSYSNENNNISRTILLEGVEHTFQFTNEINKYILIYPFFYSSTQHSLLYMNVMLPEKNSVLVKMDFNDNKYMTTAKYNISSNNTFLLHKEMEQYCIDGKLCMIKVTVQSLENSSFSIQFYNSEYKQIYCLKNILCNAYHRGVKKYLIYSEVQRGEIGDIFWNYQNELINVYYKIIDKSDPSFEKSQLIQYNTNYSGWTQMNINEGSIKYYVDDTFTCKKGCEIYVIIQDIKTDPLDEDLRKSIYKIEISIRKLNSPLIGKFCSPLYGYISQKKENQTYLYTMSNEIKGFEIKIFGYHTTFFIEDLNKTNPCCDNINKQYSSTMYKKFIDFHINPDINTSDYNVIILITVIPHEIFAPFEEQYEIEVIPFLYVNYPVHYHSKDKVTECKTDENKRCYLIIDQKSLDIFYTIPHDKYGKITNNVTNIVNIDEFYSHEWDKLFTIQKDYKYNYIFSVHNSKITLISYTFRDIDKYFVAIEFDSLKELIIFDSSSVTIEKELLLMNDMVIKTRLNKQGQYEINELFYSNTELTNFDMNIEFVVLEGFGQVLTSSGASTSIPLIGTTTLLFHNITSDFEEDINIFSYNTLESSVKLNYKLKQHYIISQLNLSQVNLLSFNNGFDFPYIIVYQLDKAESNFTLNVQFEKKEIIEYNFLNLNIEAGYINQNNITELYNNTSSNGLLKQEVIYINNHQIAIINFSLSEEQRKFYDFIYFKISEKEKMNIQLNPNIIIEGIQNNYKNNPDIPFFQNYYFFNYIDPNASNTSYYLIQNQDNLITFEFSSCTNDEFELSFLNIEDYSKLSDVQITKEKNNGKLITTLKAEENYNLPGKFYLKIELKNKNKEHDYQKLYYGIKYMNDFEFCFELSNTYLSNLSSKYDESNGQINSNWGQINNTFELNVNYIYLVLNTKEYYTDSICFIETPIFTTTTTKNYLSTKSSEKEFDYQTVIIATFLNENEKVMIGYNLSGVHNKYSLIWLWIIIVFVFIILFFIYTTITLYKEAKLNANNKKNVLIEFDIK